MSDRKTFTKVTAEADVDLTPEQQAKLQPLLDEWQLVDGMILGSLVEQSGKFRIGFRQVPFELGLKIIEMVNQHYSEKKDVSS